MSQGFFCGSRENLNPALGSPVSTEVQAETMQILHSPQRPTPAGPAPHQGSLPPCSLRPGLRESRRCAQRPWPVLCAAARARCSSHCPPWPPSSTGCIKNACTLVPLNRPAPCSLRLPRPMAGMPLTLHRSCAPPPSIRSRPGSGSPSAGSSDPYPQPLPPSARRRTHTPRRINRWSAAVARLATVIGP
jgi:hypothetical protein